MKNKYLKRIISLVLVLVMMVSTMAVSVVSTSATGNKVEYTIQASTGDGDCKSVDIMKIKINGEKGSTGWHDVAALCVIPGKTERSFKDIDVGEITSISVKNAGIDSWYPKRFVVSSPSSNVTIYGGKWVHDMNEVVFSITDYVVYFTICTDSEIFSGTDADVYMTFYDVNGKVSEKFDLSSIHPQLNSFELGDVFRSYVSLPSNFGKLDKVMLSIEKVGKDGNLLNLGADWKVEFIDTLVVSGLYKGNKSMKILHQWCKFDKPIITKL